ncbi:MAG: lysozyme [Cyanobacteria bacterium P01_G01_bin.39]
MRLKSAIFNCYTFLTLACGITFNFTLNTSPAWAIDEVAQKSQNYAPINHNQTLIASNLALPPEAVDLVKNFEGFSASAYTDTNGLPVIGYGQTRINGQTVRLGQYITQAQANISLLKELTHIQNLVKSHVQVDLNPHQLGALTSLVFNAGTVILTDSTLIRKLNAGDYTGAAQEFPRWNKADKGGQLVPFPGLTRRRLAEKKLFLTPYQQIASN